MKTKRILITGGTGFVGRNLIGLLIKGNYECFNLGRSRNEFCENVNWDLKKDINDCEMPGKIDTIVHAASIVGVDKDISKDEYIDINIKSTAMILDYAIKNNVRHFIYVSTGGVYGFSDRELSEEMNCNPGDIYSVTKYISELICNMKRDKIKITILRMFFPYGRGQTGRLIPNLIEKIFKSEQIILNRGGLPRINPIHVDDAVEIMKEIIEGEVEGTFNIGGDENISIRDICYMIARNSGIKDLEYKYSGIECKNLIGLNDKIMDILEYEIGKKMEAGIVEILEGRLIV